ncbi:PilN domain-containing protein [Anaerosalibacter massiliensis]|nr:PilN domain-containing protein [Anaerosalibacter massiliensis]
MKDLNFFSPYVKPNRFEFEILYYFLILSFIAGVIFYSFINEMKIDNLLKEVNILKKEAQNEEIQIKVKKLKREKEEIEKDKNITKELNSLEKVIEEEDIIDEKLLKEITLRTPKNISLNSIEINSNVIDIKGIGEDKFSIAQFEHNLNEAEKFKDVFVSNISFGENNYNFSLIISLKEEDVRNNEDNSEREN